MAFEKCNGSFDLATILGKLASVRDFGQKLFEHKVPGPFKGSPAKRTFSESVPAGCADVVAPFALVDGTLSGYLEAHRTLHVLLHAVVNGVVC